MDYDNDLLLRAIALLESEVEYASFFTDLLTPKEFKQISNRLHVFLQLLEGLSQRAICENTGVAIATVSRANRVLEDGGEGIRIVAQRLKQ